VDERFWVVRRGGGLLCGEHGTIARFETKYGSTKFKEKGRGERKMIK
jgi:hypothetical protein